MSYILDALKRADAERERGAVPGLHAQPADMALPDEPRGLTLPPWAWGLGGLGVALLGMLAWSMWRGDEAPAGNGAQPPSMAQPGPAGQAGSWAPQGERRQPPMGMASGAWGPGPQGGMQQPPHDAHMARGTIDQAADGNAGMGQRPPMPAMRGDARSDGGTAPGGRRFAPQNDLASTTANTASPVVRGEAHDGVTAPVAEPRPTPRQTADQASPTQADSTASSATATSPPSRVYALNDLPDNVRRNLPQLVIGGAMYSDNPRSRMLIINTQLFHEGDKLGPDLTLEEIKLKSAVLRYKSYRYSVTY